MVTIADLMRECRNCFEYAKLSGTFEIKNDCLTPSDKIKDGQYVAIQGSIFHNGVFQIYNGALTGEGFSSQDEIFSGDVYLLAPPNGFLSLVNQINDFDEKNPKSAYSSESFGNYSHTHATGAGGGNITWQEAFKKDLMPYKRFLKTIEV